MKKRNINAPRKKNETTAILASGLVTAVLVGGLIFYFTRPHPVPTSKEELSLTDAPRAEPLKSVSSDTAGTTTGNLDSAARPAKNPELPVEPVSPPLPTLAAGSAFTLGPGRVVVVDVEDSGESPVFKKPGTPGFRFAIVTLRLEELAPDKTLEDGKIVLRGADGSKIPTTGGFQTVPKSQTEVTAKLLSTAMANRPNRPGTYKLSDASSIDLTQDMHVANGMVMKAGGSMAFANGLNVGYEGPMAWVGNIAWDGIAGVFFEIPSDLNLQTCFLEYL